MKARRARMKIKVRKASKKLKARRAHKKMKACIRQRYKRHAGASGTWARRACRHARRVGNKGTRGP